MQLPVFVFAMFNFLTGEELLFFGMLKVWFFAFVSSVELEDRFFKSFCRGRVCVLFAFHRSHHHLVSGDQLAGVVFVGFFDSLSQKVIGDGLLDFTGVVFFGVNPASYLIEVGWRVLAAFHCLCNRFDAGDRFGDRLGVFEHLFEA